MFIGTFTHSFDEKGRLTLPARFREELAPGVVITKGLDNCLYVYPRAVFDEMAHRMAKLPLKERNAQRYFFASASDDIPDRQGRVLVAPNLRRWAGLDGETVITGLNDRLEVWHPDRWAEVSAREDPEALAEQLQEYGI
jgi:transcriptional regulator MraZ